MHRRRPREARLSSACALEPRVGASLRRGQPDTRGPRWGRGAWVWGLGRPARHIEPTGVDSRTSRGGARHRVTEGGGGPQSRALARPGHSQQVGSVPVQDGAESQAVPEGAAQVADVHAAVALTLAAAPGQEGAPRPRHGGPGSAGPDWGWDSGFGSRGSDSGSGNTRLALGLRRGRFPAETAARLGARGATGGRGGASVSSLGSGAARAAGSAPDPARSACPDLPAQPPPRVARPGRPPLTHRGPLFSLWAGRGRPPPPSPPPPACQLARAAGEREEEEAPPCGPAHAVEPLPRKGGRPITPLLQIGHPFPRGTPPGRRDNPLLASPSPSPPAGSPDPPTPEAGHTRLPLACLKLTPQNLRILLPDFYEPHPYPV